MDRQKTYFIVDNSTLNWCNSNNQKYGWRSLQWYKGT